MARIKGAMMTRKRRNKTLKLAKGYYGSKKQTVQNCEAGCYRNPASMPILAASKKSVISAACGSPAFLPPASKMG